MNRNHERAKDFLKRIAFHWKDGRQQIRADIINHIRRSRGIYRSEIEPIVRSNAYAARLAILKTIERDIHLMAEYDKIEIETSCHPDHNLVCVNVHRPSFWDWARCFNQGEFA